MTYARPISVVIPARDEGARVSRTITSALVACERPDEVEFVVVDDCSSPSGRPVLTGGAASAVVRVVRSDRHLGVGTARNLGVRHAAAPIVFITDAHVGFSPLWDSEVRRLLHPGRILAATIADRATSWRGHGCRLVVPHMGTHWNPEPESSEEAPRVQIASSAGTALERELFERIGGYDEGMVHYGGFEPEFSLRAWLSGAEIVLARGITLTHRFKTAGERRAFIPEARTAMVHNCLRFAVAHLPEPLILEAVRLQALEFPHHMGDALRMLEEHDAWGRREELRAKLRYDFAWFAATMGLVDQIGSPLPLEPAQAVHV
ncbi:glycosyltransferase family 2 protein [Streptomyces sp. NPDC058613]|uniref:glycosyltransferase family 2 protein n=1 Tax=Streptomyces sp. NPDC058613 TaxID=3346556 RepID=UPI0036603378